MFKRTALVLLAACVVVCMTPGANAAPGDRSPEGVWTEVSAPAAPSPTSRRVAMPSAYRVYELDNRTLNAILASAPMEFSVFKTVPTIMTLPMPSGEFARFTIEQSPILSPEMRAQHPDIKTYVGQGIDDPTATVRLDMTLFGFRAMVLSVNGSVYIDPVEFGNTRQFMVYNKSDFPYDPDGFTCDASELPVEPEYRVAGAPSGDQLRTYRMVITATGEYTEHWGSVANAVAQIVTTVNRVTGVFERDCAVRFNLVRTIVFTDPDTDPFPTGASVNGDLLDQNQTVADDSVGSGGYDIGHILSQGGSGGLAACGACKSNKARGGTSRGNPSGDPFDIDFVAHEVGHQMCASHTFNGTTNSCGGGNRSASSAYEPGSGTTIMAYAGICGPQNVQANSDDYFHVRSLQQITDYREGDGSCAPSTPTGNTPPNANAGADCTIPTATPFTLTGSGSDADGHPLTYCWEQYDLGDPSPPANNANGPMFRSLSPTTSSSRTLPRMEDILSGAATPWELLPTVDRTLTFRLTVRDNRANGGGIDWDEMTVTVAGDPFEITYPNGGESLSAGCAETVTWTVGGGSVAANVRISYSTNGGGSWTTLLASTPNDGSAMVTIPCGGTSDGRIRVSAVGNIFFDVSDGDFSVLFGGPAAPQISGASVTGGAVDANCERTVTFTALVTDDCSISASNVSATPSIAIGLATLGTPSITKTAVSDKAVLITGSVVVSDVLGSPVTVQVEFEGEDGCGASASQIATAQVFDNIPPALSISATGGQVDANCEYVIPFSGTVTDNCPINAADISLDLALLTSNALMDAAAISIVQVDPTTVSVDGTVLVYDLLDSPATVEFILRAPDSYGAEVTASTTAHVTDDTPPAISVWATGGSVDDNCEYLMPFGGTVTDNCPLDAADVWTGVVLLTGNAVLDAPVITIVQADDRTVSVDGVVLVSTLTGSPATVEITIHTIDSYDNDVSMATTADVIDDIPPVVTCANAIAASFSSQAEATVAWITTATDNCDPDPDIACYPPPESAFDLGYHWVMCTATDDSQNMDSCEFRFALVALDIKPGSCPNPLNVKKQSGSMSAAVGGGMPVLDDGAFPIAVLGSAEFDVADIDPSTITLEGVSPARWNFEDAATPVVVDPERDCECTQDRGGGFADMIFKFSSEEIVAAIGTVADGDEIVLTLYGRLWDGTPIAGGDCVLIRAKKPDYVSRLDMAAGDQAASAITSYPNPFNASTTITYGVDDASHVNLAVYNILGQKIATLVDREQPAGAYAVTWNGRDASGGEVSSGMYLYRLTIGATAETRKMTLLK